MERIKVGGIMQSEGRAVVKVMSCPDRADIAGLVLGALGARNVNIEFLVQSFDLDGFSNFTLCIDRMDLEPAIEALEAIKPSLEAKVISYNPNVAVVSVFGPHFREKPKISGAMFSALASVGIKSIAISTSISSVSCVVDAEDVEAAVGALHEAFEAPHQVKQRPKAY
ncbi:MAG: ACT domain-containing protein [Syntrophobacterales bacterium]|nr:MAG: ACT domain-containing protein [Syntrophobacterales bacterium]